MKGNLPQGKGSGKGRKADNHKNRATGKGGKAGGEGAEEGRAGGVQKPKAKLDTEKKVKGECNFRVFGDRGLN